MRLLGGLIALLVLLGLGFWVNSLRQEKKHLASRIERMERLAATNESARQQRIITLRNQIRGEQERLTRLRSALASVTRMAEQPPTGSVAAHLTELNEQIQAIQTRIVELAQRDRELKVSKQVFQDEQQNRAISERLQIHASIQGIDELLLSLQRLPRLTQEDIVRIASLRTQREQLQNQLQAIGTMEQASLLSAEQATRADLDAVALEHENLTAQLKDLREEEAYWRRSPAANRAARIQQLQEQIRGREQRLSLYEQQLRDLVPRQ